MRNPIRVKNLRLRFLPLYVAALVLLAAVRPSPAFYTVGVLAILAGAALRTWGAGHLVKTASLTITGPYAHVRHPLYLGTLLVGSGMAVMVGGVPAIVVLALFLPWFFLRYFPRKERSEAERLEAAHGPAFREYWAAVPALLPRLSAWVPGAAMRERADFSATWPRSWSLARYSENNELGTLLALLALVAAFGVRTWMIPCSP
jgi:protein-S-isoprenylcysteine O-methyltransferase Ste14